MRINEIVLTEEQLEEISAKDIGAGALAGMMALTPVSKAFGATQNTDPLPNKQTSTMVQKDVAGKKDLSKIQAPAEKDFWKVTINYKGKDVNLKLPFSAGTNKKQIKQYIDDMMSENGVKDYSVKDIDTLNKAPTDPLPNKQTSTMVQKDKVKSGKFDPNSLKSGDKFYQVTLISDKGSMVKYHSIKDAKSTKELEQKYDKIMQKYNLGSYNINVQGRIMR